MQYVTLINVHRYAFAIRYLWTNNCMCIRSTEVPYRLRCTERFEYFSYTCHIWA